MYFLKIKYAHFSNEEIEEAYNKILSSSNGIEYYATKLKKELDTQLTSPYFENPKGVSLINNLNRIFFI